MLLSWPKSLTRGSFCVHAELCKWFAFLGVEHQALCDTAEVISAALWMVRAGFQQKRIASVPSQEPGPSNCLLRIISNTYTCKNMLVRMFSAPAEEMKGEKRRYHPCCGGIKRWLLIVTPSSSRTCDLQGNGSKNVQF